MRSRVLRSGCYRGSRARRSAIAVGSVYRGTAVRQLAGLLLFGDNPSGEVFSINADALPRGGQDAIRRILFNVNGATRTLLELINDRRMKHVAPEDKTR